MTNVANQPPSKPNAAASASHIFTDGKSNPETLAKCVLLHRETAVKEEVSSDVVLLKGVTEFRDDADALAQFRALLVEFKLLDPDEVGELLDAKNSHFSMLKKIAENAEVILHPSIIRYLRPGYSSLYQTILLWEDLGRDLGKLHKIIAASRGPLTRNSLLSAREAVKATHHHNESSEIRPAVQPHQSEQKNTVGAVSSATSLPVSAMILTPSRQDEANMRKDYVTEDEPPCLQVKTAKDAVVILILRVADFSTFAAKLSCWGIARVNHVYLLKPPSGPDLTDAQILVVCERGRAHAAVCSEWPAETDPRKIAVSLLENVSGRRAHLFAKEEIPGWEAVIGKANWQRSKESVA